MTDYADVVESLKYMKEYAAEVDTLYLSEDTIEEWADDDNFSTSTDSDGSIGTVKAIDVETDDDERLTGKTSNGEKVTISVPP